MHAALDIESALVWVVILAVACGIIMTVAGACAVYRFRLRQLRPGSTPAVTVLKPLCGDEPLLEEALTSICAQRYPEFQIVFGVQDQSDPALCIVRRLRRRFPHCDLAVVIEPASHGPNRKVSNLINMLPAARHDILVFSDSDLHVAPDYLERLVAELEQPGIGLVTTVCSGLPTGGGVIARLGAMHISHSFLPGALLARAMGRQDCLGTTMALNAETLCRIGGLGVLTQHVAEDNLLGQLVGSLGLRTGLASTVPATGVPEIAFSALWQHELRWARTIRSLEPLGFAVSVIQFPLLWAILAVLLTGGAPWAVGLFVVAWLTRATAALWVDRILSCSRANAVLIWLLPLRDLLSVLEIAVSFLGRRVVWRGHAMQATCTRSGWVRRWLGSVTATDAEALDVSLPPS